MRVIRALSRTDYERERYDGVNEELARIEQKAGRISSASGPATTLVLNLGLTAVIITGAYLVQKGETGPGAIIAFLSYFISECHAGHYEDLCHVLQRDGFTGTDQ